MQVSSMLLHPEIFNADSGIVAGFSTRHAGVSEPPFDALNLGLSTGDDPDLVAENRRRAVAALGFSTDQLAIAGQVHGTKVKEVDKPGLFPGYDAMVTRTPGILLCISAADCAAVLLADSEAGVIGACHAGWRGAAGRIVGATVARMKQMGAHAARMQAYISPCISAEHFEVGPEVAAQFSEAFVRRFPGREKPHVDLKAALAGQLQEAGLPADAVEVSPFCTVAANADFYSYRAEGGRTGRMMGFIGMGGQRT